MWHFLTDNGTLQYITLSCILNTNFQRIYQLNKSERKSKGQKLLYKNMENNQINDFRMFRW